MTSPPPIAKEDRQVPTHAPHETDRDTQDEAPAATTSVANPRRIRLSALPGATG